SLDNVFGYIPGSPTLVVDLTQHDNFSISLSAHIHDILSTDFDIIPSTVIPVDRTNCPGYTGPSVNPYCATQISTHTTNSEHSSTSTMHTPSYSSYSTGSQNTITTAGQGST
ncbi:hypothetical protein, partial [Salmonella sp. s51228]|uniref:hypothetical protein n=1 Tax=Salmonella sp. s51228 TaxID=3159652 RepID=UPI003981535E